MNKQEIDLEQAYKQMIQAAEQDQASKAQELATTIASSHSFRFLTEEAKHLVSHVKTNYHLN